MNKRQTKIGVIILIGLFLIQFLLGSSYLNAQKTNIRFKHISIEEGLSGVTVNGICQDSIGFMWFGTQDGLNRYDGYEFKVYQNIPQDPESISENYIRCLLKDRSGFLWIGTNWGGLNKFDFETSKFTRYKYPKDGAANVGDNDIWSICEDHSEVLWIGTHNGLKKFDPKTERFILLPPNPEEPGGVKGEIRSIYEDRNHVLWVGTYGEGLYKFKLESNRYICDIHYLSEESSLSNNWITSIWEDKNGSLWIGTERGLNVLNRNQGGIITYTHNKKDQNSLSSDEIRCIYEDKSGELWIGTKDGLNKFDYKSKQFTRYVHDEAKPHSLSNNDVRAIFEDSFGILWISCRGKGLNEYYKRAKQFSLYPEDSGDPNSVIYNGVWAIYEDRYKMVWIGTNFGLNKFDRTTEKFTLYQNEKGNSPRLSYNDVRSILKDRNDVLWFGTYGGGLNRYNRKEDNFKCYKINPSKSDRLNENRIISLCEDRYRTLWIGTEAGLYISDPKKPGFVSYTHNPNIPGSLSADRIFYIFEDRAGILWIGTAGGGLNRFDREKNAFIRYPQDDSNLTNLRGNRVFFIHEDKKKVLWIGTELGLNKMIDREKGEFESYSEKDGLPNNKVYGILEDENGNLWLSTNNGLSRFDPIKKEFSNFYVDDGLQGNEFNNKACFKNNDGEMFFGGVNGFNVFKPEKIAGDPNPPGVVITDFLLANKSVQPEKNGSNSLLHKPIYKTDSLTLSYRQNLFSFEFSALHYASPGMNRYKYKLEGYDVGEIPTDAKNRRATYSNIPPGDYVFKVKGSNKDGVWNKEAAAVRVKILPPPWKTGWAYTLYLLVSVVILYLIWSAFTKRLLQREVNEQTKILKETQAQLVQSEKMAGLGIIVSGVAHEINNPTSFSHTSAYNLKRDLEKLKTFLIELAGEDADEEILKDFEEKFAVLFSHLNSIKEGTERISKIVSNLRTFSRIEKGEMKPIKLLEGLQITINLIKTQFKDKVDFIIDFQADPLIEGNSAELNQVFMDIIINGCQAIVDKLEVPGQKIKGILTIQSAIEDDNAIIRFKDSGIGMSQEVQDKIFVPFFTTRPVGKGTGLGLYISYGIIKKHRGRIEVNSEEGKGTTITLYLPLMKEEILAPEER